LGSIKESLIVTQCHLCLELANCLKCNTYHDKERCTTESKLCDSLNVPLEVACDDRNCHREAGNEAKEDCADRCDSVKNLFDIIGGGLTGTNTGNGASVVLNVVCNLYRIERDHDVEVRESNDKDDVDYDIDPAVIAEVLCDPCEPSYLGEECCKGCGERSYGACEDDRHNACHVDLEGKVSSLSAVHLTADNSLSVLDRDSSLRVGNAYDKHNDRNDNHKANDCKNEAPDAEAVEAAACEHERPDATCKIRNSGDDVCEKDHGYTVTDTELIDLFCHPHNNGSTCTVASNHYDVLEDIQLIGRIEGKHSVVTEKKRVSYCGDETECYGYVTCDSVDLLLAFRALLRESLESGNSYCKKLHNDRCGDVR